MNYLIPTNPYPQITMTSVFLHRLHPFELMCNMYTFILSVLVLFLARDVRGAQMQSVQMHPDENS